ASTGDASWIALADQLGLARLEDVAPLPAEGRVVVPMHALLKFLEFPLQGWARFRVGLDEIEDDDPMAREGEPFETDYGEETLMLRAVLLDARGGRSIQEAYDAAVRERELRGQGPSGIFAQGERGDHLHALESWQKALAATGVELAGVEV